MPLTPYTKSQKLNNIADNYLKKHPVDKSIISLHRLTMHVCNSIYDDIIVPNYAPIQKLLQRNAITIEQVFAVRIKICTDLIERMEKSGQSDKRKDKVYIMELLAGMQDVVSNSSSIDLTLTDPIADALKDIYCLSDKDIPPTSSSYSSRDRYRELIERIEKQETLIKESVNSLVNKFNDTKDPQDKSEIKSALIRKAKYGEITQDNLPSVKKIFSSKSHWYDLRKTNTEKDIEIFSKLYCNDLFKMTQQQLVKTFNAIKDGSSKKIYGDSKDQSLSAIKYVLLEKLKKEKKIGSGIKATDINNVIDHHHNCLSSVFIKTSTRKCVNKNSQLTALLNMKNKGTDKKTKENIFKV